MKNEPIIIIGAGLTGLTLAYLLKKQGIQSVILEARDRVGGRILTVGSDNVAPIEMGATWLGTKHQQLRHLLNELELPTFEQRLGQTAIYEAISTSPPQLVQLPPNDDPSFRIANGTTSLIQTLVDQLDSTQILLSTVVKSISATDQELILETNTQTFTAPKVVSTLPPYLLLNTIQCSPSLPADLENIVQSTHTWMGDSIKIGLRYASPFWRSSDKSGTIVSNVGPIPEMYDHSNIEDNLYALKGFFNGAYFSVSKEERLELVLQQLEKYYGPVARQYSSYEEVIWRKEPYTFTPYQQHILPHQNNGHPLYQKPWFNNRLFIAGSETARQFPGYMEGAVQSALQVANQIIDR